MQSTNPEVDHYFTEGCMRCPLGATPECKINNWPEELKYLRKIVLDCGLTEELKWGIPCYTFQKSNVVIVAAFKAYCSIAFFKGVLLNDAEGILEKPGENTRTSRQIRFTSVGQVIEIEATLKAYIYEAIEVERAGLTVELDESLGPIPEELEKKLQENPVLKAAFEALTPGRQRGYILYFSAPKQSKTRESRIEKYTPQILIGKGLGD